MPGRLVRSAHAMRIDVNIVACASAHPHNPMTTPIAEQKLTETARTYWGFCTLNAQHPQRPHRAAPPHTPLTLTRSHWEEQ